MTDPVLSEEMDGMLGRIQEELGHLHASLAMGGWNMMQDPHPWGAGGLTAEGCRQDANHVGEILEMVAALRGATPALNPREQMERDIYDTPFTRTPEWRGMESAPRDGRWLLGWWGGDRVESMRWTEDSGWTHYDGDSTYTKPTHWMPLPPPPGTKETGLP